MGSCLAVDVKLLRDGTIGLAIGLRLDRVLVNAFRAALFCVISCASSRRVVRAFALSLGSFFPLPRCYEHAPVSSDSRVESFVTTHHLVVDVTTLSTDCTLQWTWSILHLRISCNFHQFYPTYNIVQEAHLVDPRRNRLARPRRFLPEGHSHFGVSYARLVQEFDKAPPQLMVLRHVGIPRGLLQALHARGRPGTMQSSNERKYRPTWNRASAFRGEGGEWAGGRAVAAVDDDGRGLLMRVGHSGGIVHGRLRLRVEAEEHHGGERGFVRLVNSVELHRVTNPYGLLIHASRSSSFAEQRSSGFHLTIFRMNAKNRALSSPSKFHSDCSRLSSGRLAAPIQFPEAKPSESVCRTEE